MSVNKAEVIMIGERFFCGFGKAGRVNTAWSLAGAKLYLPESGFGVFGDYRILKCKGKKPVVRAVFLAGPDPVEGSE